MTVALKDYALIGDGETAALVSKEGSIDWLCWPRFHSEACFAALIGNSSNGRWSVRPGIRSSVSRSYRNGTPVLETRFVTSNGVARLIDFMTPRSDGTSCIVRIIRGEKGTVSFCMEIALRFDYGRLRPGISKIDDKTVDFVSGPHAVRLRAPVAIECGDVCCGSNFEIAAGERKIFTLQYRRSHQDQAKPPEGETALRKVEQAWRKWTSHCTYVGPYRGLVLRSLITMKLLTSWETGGIVAAATTGLPEKIGGERNWDYRFCWLRDATFTLLAFLHSGYKEEARAWRDWLLRAIAGMPKDLQPVYGIAGQHRIPEWTVDWLEGYRGSRPVRVGNRAYSQFQLDVYGEILDALHQAREQGIEAEDQAWQLQRQLVEQVEHIWQDPDAGIWESRSKPEHFTYSRVMAWVAVDRAVKAAEKYSLGWPIARWRKLRDRIHKQICEQGYDAASGSFTRSYETREPDGANLLLPIVGFLPANDKRICQTVELTERKLMGDGYVYRYDINKSRDGLPEDEGAFLACNFWHVDNLIMQGRAEEARERFETLLKLCNDVGLLSEEYDPKRKELVGNFPQALSHLALVNTAHNLEPSFSPAQARSGKKSGKVDQPS